MQHGVERLNTRKIDIALLGQLERRAKVGFNLHRSPGNKVLPHDTLGVGWLYHIVDDLLLELGAKFAPLRFGKPYHLVNDIINEIFDPDLL